MSAIRRATLRKLAATAYEMNLDVMDGELHRGEDGRWHIGRHDLLHWLEAHADEDVVVVLGSLADQRPVETRTCRTCGRDYQDLECPTCRANRIRLRGR
jgi:hypothetical protein